MPKKTRNIIICIILVLLLIVTILTAIYMNNKTTKMHMPINDIVKKYPSEKNDDESNNDNNSEKFKTKKRKNEFNIEKNPTTKTTHSKLSPIYYFMFVGENVIIGTLITYFLISNYGFKKGEKQSEKSSNKKDK